jgi:hypothetical protein
MRQVNQEGEAKRHDDLLNCTGFMYKVGESSRPVDMKEKAP